jgi:hypothetical protein
VRRKVFRIVTAGGIGDAIAMTPLFRALKEDFSPCRIRLSCLSWKHLDVFRNNPHVDSMSTFLTAPLEFVRFRLRRDSFIYLNSGRYSGSLYYPGHITSFLAGGAGVRLRSSRMELYLTEQEEREGQKLLRGAEFPVALHATPFGTRNKVWELGRWKEIISQNPGLQFFQLGTGGDESVRGAIDLRGTKLRVGFAIIKAARLFVGVDSCFAHAASAMGTPGVVVFGPTSTTLWGNSGNINISRNYVCAPCESLLGPHPCPYGAPCMTAVSVADVQAAIDAAKMQLT